MQNKYQIFIYFIFPLTFEVIFYNGEIIIETIFTS